MSKRLIYAEDAIDALADDLSYYGSGDERAFGMSRAIGIIEKLPSAQPQRIKGRWKLLPGRDDEHIRYLHCSVCHFNGDYESNFCPNCGADMRGDEDE